MAIKYLNKDEFEYSNIINWHKKGYTGKDIKVANLESGNPNAWNLEGKVCDPFNIKRSGTNNHGDKVIDILLQVAPNAKVYMLPSGGDYSDGKCEGNLIDKTLPYIIENNIHLVNASMYGNNVDCVIKKVSETKDNGTIFITASGNAGDRGSWGYSSNNGWITIGAAHLGSNGEVNIADYSSKSNVVDFAQFSNVNVHNQKYRDYIIRITGTSFASPMMCGMLALVQQFFLEKAGRTLYQDEIYQFILDNTIDLGEEGKDIEYGHGVFVLPNPDDIDINKYIKIEKLNKNDDNQAPNNNEREEDIMKFKDVPQGKWSEKNIDLISNLGIMNGYPDGTFKPTKEVTREELATVLANFIDKFDIRRK